MSSSLSTGPYVQDLRITQKKEEKYTAAVKTGGDDVGKRNHPQWGHLLVRGCKLKAGLYFCPMPTHYLSQKEVGAGELRRRWAQQHGAVLGPARWIWTLAVVVWIYKGIKKPKPQQCKALKYSVIAADCRPTFLPTFSLGLSLPSTQQGNSAFIWRLKH